MRGAIICFGILISNAVEAQFAIQPSFDCRLAVSADERMICGDARLAELDQTVNLAFTQLSSKEKAIFRASSRELLAARKRCGSDRLCIVDNQISALQLYNIPRETAPAPPWVGAYRISVFQQEGRQALNRLPQRIGECGITRITSISDRFGNVMKEAVERDDFDSGTALQFSNRGFQVSYSFNRPVAASVVGDMVLMCLVSIPKDCPPNDDRGRVYSTTNFRTRGYWIMPDAQHMCGGA